MPKFIKSSSSTDEHELETLRSPNTSSHTVIKIHEDSDNSKSKASSKLSFWGSPALPHVLRTSLKDSYKSLIISMNLCSIKNMIQLFDAYLHEVGNLFSRQDLRDSIFQDSIIKVLKTLKDTGVMSKRDTRMF
jgi:hypothetical protein